MLSTQFFKREKFQQVNDFVYEGYTCKYPQSTLVLYSKKSGNALAALTIQPKNTNNGLNWAVCTARPAPVQKIKALSDDTVFFQGLFNQDNQEIQLTISNLSPLPQGFIVFNVLHVDPKTNQVEQVNLINELFYNQSYTIPCDKRTSTAMILKGMVQPKEEGSKTMEKVSVEQAEKENGVTSGLYFSLNVQPNAGCPELCDEFSLGTKWECASHFVRVFRNENKVPSFRNDNVSDSFLGDINGSDDGGDEEDDDDEEAYWGNNRRDARATNFIFLSSQPQLPTLCQVSTRLSPQSCSRSCDSPQRFLSSDKSILSKLKSSGQKLLKKLSPSLSEESSSVSNPEPDKDREASDASDAPSINMVQKSQAGQLDHGKTKITETSVLSTREFKPELASSPSVLSLSILPFDFKIQRHDANQSEKELNELFDEFLKSSGKNMIDKLNQIYFSETCVIDLTQKPDTVVIQCGHACFHHSNVNKSAMKTCPLCRKPILALVRMDNQALL